MSSRLLSAACVADHLGIPRRSAHRLLRAMPHYKFGKLVRVSQDDLATHIKSLGNPALVEAFDRRAYVDAVPEGLEQRRAEAFKTAAHLAGASDGEMLVACQIERLLPGEVVYFVRGQRTGLVKIGTARDVRDRVRALQYMSPDVLILLGLEPGGRAREQALHRGFNRFRKHGEWFAWSEALASYMLTDVLRDEGTGWRVPAGWGARR